MSVTRERYLVFGGHTMNMHDDLDVIAIWPQAFDGLTPEQKHDVANVLKANPKSGWKPHDFEVFALTAYVRGEIPLLEYFARRAVTVPKAFRNYDDAAMGQADLSEICIELPPRFPDEVEFGAVVSLRRQITGMIHRAYPDDAPTAVAQSRAFLAESQANVDPRNGAQIDDEKARLIVLRDELLAAEAARGVTTANARATAHVADDDETQVDRKAVEWEQ